MNLLIGTEPVVLEVKRKRLHFSNQVTTRITGFLLSSQLKSKVLVGLTVEDFPCQKYFLNRLSILYSVLLHFFPSSTGILAKLKWGGTVLVKHEMKET